MSAKVIIKDSVISITKKKRKRSVNVKVCEMLRKQFHQKKNVEETIYIFFFTEKEQGPIFIY